MSEERTIDEVKFAIDVAVPVDHAFRVFTEQFDSIKPREHNLLAVDIAETVLEAKPGGAVYDRGVDGSVCVWGRVLEVEAPHRLANIYEHRCLIGPCACHRTPNGGHLRLRVYGDRPYNQIAYAWHAGACCSSGKRSDE